MKDLLGCELEVGDFVAHVSAQGSTPVASGPMEVVEVRPNGVVAKAYRRKRFPGGVAMTVPYTTRPMLNVIRVQEGR